MSWFSRLFGGRKETDTVKNQAGSFSLTDVDAWIDRFGGTFASSGPLVTADTAMRCSAVFACVRLIAGAVACSPLRIYKHGDKAQRAPAFAHPLSPVLRLRPNRFMSAASFWKWMLTSKLLQGNAYAHIMRGRNGTPFALMPVSPRNVMVYWAWELGLDAKLGVERNRLFYAVTWPDGNFQIYDQDDILHIPNIGGDGKRGVSTIQAMAQAVGLALAAEESSSAFFANGMPTQLSLSYPAKLSPEAVKSLREHLADRYSGAKNHHTPLILTEGGEAKSLSMSAEDTQLLESRKFSVIDICRFFGVNPVLVGESEKTSSWGSGVEQMGRWFHTLTMNEHFTAIEQELEIKLFGDGHFAEFDETELTRGDTKTRADAYNVMRGSLTQPGIMTQNEIRAAEGLEPLEGGDKLFEPQPGTKPKEATA